jgi:hypothetical protein
MKIGTYIANAQGNIDPQKVFRPLQTILIDVHGKQQYDSVDFLTLAAKLNVTLINSKTGNQDSIIPFVTLNLLGEIATMHEGSVIYKNGQDFADGISHLLVPVLLNPASNLQIDNDKYLDIELSGLLPGQTVDLYGFETQSLSEMVCKYSKFSIPIGTSRNTTTVGSNDVLALPVGGFDSIRLSFTSGVVADMSPIELDYYMAKENDLTLTTTNPTDKIIYSRGNHYILDLNGIKSFEIVRDSDSTAAFEFVLGDLH